MVVSGMEQQHCSHGITQASIIFDMHYVTYVYVYAYLSQEPKNEIKECVALIGGAKNARHKVIQ